jgi:uncharacterized protein YbjT (DUF2867 family)
MASLILVTGGTGRLGRLITARLAEAGHETRVLSRHPHAARAGIEYMTGDLATGKGVEAAVDGATAVVHCVSSSKGDAETTRVLVQAMAAANRAARLVFISIVGADRVHYGYFRSKVAAEAVVTGSGLPWTMQRATQFYGYCLDGAKKMARLPVIPVPGGFKLQPVDEGEVAARLAELAVGPAAGLVADIAGPQADSYAGMLRVFVRASHRHRPVVEFPMPGTAAIRHGGLLPDQAGRVEPVIGHRTWDEYLAEKLS